jgi:hypothetical protein
MQPAAPGNAFPAPAPTAAAPGPSVAPPPSTTPTPTAYGAAVGAGRKAAQPSHVAQSLDDEAERRRSLRKRPPTFRTKSYSISPRYTEERRRARSKDDE